MSNVVAKLCQLNLRVKTLYTYVSVLVEKIGWVFALNSIDRLAEAQVKLPLLVHSHCTGQYSLQNKAFLELPFK